MSGTSKISVYSIADLKNTSDDALPNYINSLSFIQSHFYTDVRLALGYSAVLIAGVLFYVDWKLGWEVTRPYTLPAVAAYAILNGAFTYWLYWVEGSKVYVGERKGTKLVISTTTDKVTPVYNVKAQYTTAPIKPGQPPQWKEVELKGEFRKWFSSDGYFVAKPFQHFLASNVPIIGEADPKNAVEQAETAPQPKPSSAPGGKLENVNVNIDNMPELLATLAQQGQGGKARRRG